MRKFFFAFVLVVLAAVSTSSCSSTESLDEVIQESELDVSASTGTDDIGRHGHARPGSGSN